MALSQKDQIKVVVGVVFLIGAGLYFYYIWRPVNATLDTIAARVDTLEQENEVARSEIKKGNATKLKLEAEQYGRMLTQMRRLVPNANEVPTLLEQISTAARRTGLDIADVTPLGVVPGEVFDTYKYRMRVAGSYHRIAQFLTNVGSLTRIVAPINVTLTPSARPGVARRGEAPLDAAFEIVTYVAKTAVSRSEAGGQ